MDGEKKNLQTGKKIKMTEWLALMLLVGLLLGLLIVSCTVLSSKKTTATPVSTQKKASVPSATVAPTLPVVPPAQTATKAVKIAQAESSTSTQAPASALPTSEAPTSIPTNAPAQALACQWPPERVLIISVDSLRPDAVRDTTAAPFMLNFAKNGSVTWDAQTTMPSITQTGHISMLSGYDVTTHGIINNKTWQTPEAVVQVPTIFSRAKERNLITVLFSGKGHLLYIERAGFLDYSDVNKKFKDAEEAQKVVEYIQNNDFNLMFINFANVDSAGHEFEWMSNGYLAAVGVADNAVKSVIGALETKGILDSTLIIINSDHGGTGISHGDAHIPTNRTIPWMIQGPCVKSGYSIEQDVNVFDTAVMALFGLGLDVTDDLDGKLVCEIFQSPISEQCLAAQPKK